MASKQPTLLEQAKEVKKIKNSIPITPEDIELCLAWVEGSVSGSQISRVKGSGISGSGIYFYIASCLKEYIRQNPPTPKKK